MAEQNEQEPGVVFYADPVDEHGNVIGCASLTITHANPPMQAIKVPASEIVLDPDSTFHVEMPERDS